MRFWYRAGSYKKIEQDREKNKKEEYYIYDLQKDLRYSIIPLV